MQNESKTCIKSGEKYAKQGEVYVSLVPALIRDKGVIPEIYGMVKNLD